MVPVVTGRYPLKSKTKNTLMPKIFDRVGSQKPRYSAFDLSREQKLSCFMGELIPTYLDEVVPGDQFNVRSEVMMRLAPMIAPVMHRVNVYMHYFYVPNRIIWNQWEEFITGGREGTSDPTFPAFRLGENTGNSRLADYLGLPQGQGAETGETVDVSTLPFRAYQKIWNDFYRDQNFQLELDVNTATNDELRILRSRAWEKDYLTSTLPFSQRGPAVGVPINAQYKIASDVIQTSTDDPAPNGNLEIISGLTSREGVSNVRIENLADETGIDINQLRTSSALQRWLEKQARGGARYIETILSHFGVRSSDKRLQRPEYLGGGRQPIVISEVLNTTGTAEAPQGDMAGHGISTGMTNSFNNYFEEHGYVIGIMSVLPRTAYQNGIPRHWSRFDKLDYYWPEFANLGEQEVKNKEVYYDGTDEEYSEGTFGYQQRYAEYKYGRSSVHGDFRTNLDFWHMGRKFDSQTSLNEDFIVADPTQRIFAVEEQQNLWVQLYHNVKARRPMPYFANPSLR